MEGWKKTRLYSILNNKCPSCHRGDYFKNKISYNPKKFSEAREFCEVCNHKFEKELGFFYGAMYVSYALSVAFSVATFLFIYVLFPNTPYYGYIIAIPIVNLLAAPLTFRLSRLIWMNFFTSYNLEKDKTES